MHNILIVDDEAGIRDSLAGILAAMNTGIAAGGIISPPTTAQADAAGFKELVNGVRLGIPMTQSALVFKKTYVAQNRDTVLRVLRAALKAVAGWNFTVLEAAILTGAPVCGFRPVRAARDVGVKVPNPKIDTLLPVLVSSATGSIRAFTVFSATRLSTPAAAATFSTSSVLFIATSWRLGKLPAIKEVFWPQVKHFP